MPTLLIICFFGSEVRQFSHSGVISRFIEENWQVIILTRHDDEKLQEQFDPRVRIKTMPECPSSKRLRIVTSILDKVHSIRELRRGNTGWTDKKTLQRNLKKRITTKAEVILSHCILSLPVLEKGVQYLERRLIPPISEAWKNLIAQESVDVMVTNLPRIDTLLSLWKYAEQQAIPVVLCYHTRKNKNSSDRFPHRFAKIGTWNDMMRDDVLRQNSQISPKQVQSIGCTHFSCVGSHSLCLDDIELRKTIGARPETSLILYCAAAPWVINNEAKYIKIILDAIESGLLPEHTQIIVRTNPMDYHRELATTLMKTPALIVPPDWCWEQKKNWCYQRKTDQSIFNGLLRSASVCVGLPSTVSVECAVTHLPVVNIGFELPDAQVANETIMSFWHSEFNSEVRRTGAALLSDNPQKMLDNINACLNNRDLLFQQQSEMLRCLLAVRPEDSVEATFRLIHSAVCDFANG